MIPGHSLFDHTTIIFISFVLKNIVFYATIKM
nr:MAG TPA: hypothetical protein [Caudoviricetes sp.]